jgi:hypothetical protein
MAIARAAALWSAPLPPLPPNPVPAVTPRRVPVAVSPRPAPAGTAGPVPVAALLALLERADALPHRRRPVRAAVIRPGAGRTLRPLPMARPVPVPRPRAAAPVPVPPPAAVPVREAAGPAAGSRLGARLRAGVRRLAMWGAGPGGAYAAWPTAPVAVPPPGPGLVRRLALWGAGPDGAHLAWGAPRRPVPAAPRPAAGQGPVVLTELPNTPTIASAAPSPAAASSPAGAARPVLPSPRPPGPALAPAGWPARPAPGRSAPGRSAPRTAGWDRPPPRAPDAPTQAGGAVRTRGDPAPHRARGSPRPPPAPDRSSCASSSGDVARPLPSSACPTGPAPRLPRG